MEVLLNITNLKSAIVFFHLAGLAVGVGGSWILDAFLVRHADTAISKEKYELVEFVSKFVLLGLVVLWLSGFMFIAYYYLYTPEFLSNQKVWSKIVIVMILTINGLFVHRAILPTIKRYIGSSLLQKATDIEVKKMALVGSISFISWLFPIVLGVAKSLNFVVGIGEILVFYSCILIVTCCLGLMSAAIMLKQRKGNDHLNYYSALEIKLK